MKEIEVEWAKQFERRWQLDSLCNDRIRRSAMMPDEGYMPSAMFKTDNLSPQKKIKSHKLVERKYTMRSPGVYTREVDLSVWVPVNNERRI